MVTFKMVVSTVFLRKTFQFSVKEPPVVVTETSFT